MPVHRSVVEAALAPAIATLDLPTICLEIVNTPAGMETVSPAAADLIALLIAVESSIPSLGIAPNVLTSITTAPADAAIPTTTSGTMTNRLVTKTHAPFQPGIATDVNSFPSHNQR